VPQTKPITRQHVANGNERPTPQELTQSGDIVSETAVKRRKWFDPFMQQKNGMCVYIYINATMYVIYLQVSERVYATAFEPVSTQPEVQKK